MPALKRKTSLPLLVSSLVLFYSLSNAQTTRTWVGPAFTNLNVASSWDPAGVPVAGDILQFSGMGGTPSTNNLSVKLKKIIFSAGSAHTISGSTSLKIGDETGISGIDNNTTEQLTVSCPVSAEGGANQVHLLQTTGTGTMRLTNVNALTFLGNSNTNSIRFGGADLLGTISVTGAIKEAAGASNKYLTIGMDANSNTLPNTVVIFSGANTFVSPVYVSAGVLRLQSNSADGALSDNLIDVSYGASLEVQGNITLSGKRVRLNGGTLKANSGSNTMGRDILLNYSSTINNVTASTLLTLNGKIGKVTGASCNLTFLGEGNIQVNGAIGQDAGSELTDIIKSGGGTLTLSNASNYSGKIQVTAGTLTVGGAGIFPTGGGLTLQGGTFNANNLNVTLGSLVVSGNSNSVINLGGSSGTLSFTEAAGTWNSARTLTIKGWTGTPGNSGTGSRVFFPNASALTQQQLTQIVFDGYCDGATLLGSGELVPSTLPFIRTATGNPGAVNSAYVGSTITLSGCAFEGVTDVLVGASNIFPFTPTDNGHNDVVTFTLPDNVAGLVTVTTGTGTSINSINLESLGYINTIAGDWINTATWLGSIVPPAEKQVTIKTSTAVKITAPINNLNLSAPPVNAITLLNGSRLNFSAADIGDANTFIRLGNASLYFHSLNASSPASATGNPQTLGPLEINGTTNGVFSLGTAAGIHEIKFQPSNGYSWGTGANTLTIYNWEGTKELSGTRGRIFFGGDATGLTNDQLAKIRWLNPARCPSSMLLSSGELVPADNPYIATVAGTPGSSYSGYIGSKIKISGCNFDDVAATGAVRVNGEIVGSYNVIDGGETDDYIEFTMDKDTPSGLVEVEKDGTWYPATSNLLNQGYITKQDGNWGANSSWLGTSVPLDGYQVTVSHNIAMNAPVSHSGKVLIGVGGQLSINSNYKLSTDNLEVNGTLNLGSGTVSMNKDGVLTNSGTFNSDNGTVIFTEGGTMAGSSIVFNNLNIEKGTVNLPNGLANLPLVNGTLRLTTTDAAFYTTAGDAGRKALKYGIGSTLVYAMGGDRARNNEWNTEVVNNPEYAYPYHVVVDNGTKLILNGGTNYNPTTTLALKGDLLVNNGTVDFNGGTGGGLNFPLQVAGNVEVGTSTLIGELNLRAGTLTANKNGYLMVGGNLKRYKGSTFSHNNRKVVFFGDGSVGISTPGIDTSFTFQTIEINKNDQNEVVLGCPVNVLDSLYLTNGYITTDATNILTLFETVNIDGGSNSSFVNGPLVKKTSSSSSNDFEFKIGKKDAGGYKPVWVKDLVHSGTTNYTGEYFQTSTTDPPLLEPLILLGVWANDWWQVDKNGSGAARVGIPYYPTGYPWSPSGPPTGTNVGVARFNGTDWVFTKPDQTFDPGVPEFLDKDATGIIYTDILTAFSPFTIGWEYWQVLSLKLLSFSALLKFTDVHLQWALADATDLDHFELEKSMDGVGFERMATIRPNGSSQFGWIDKGVQAGTHYYRLLMVEKNGSKEHSRIELVQVGGLRTIITGIRQNPVQGGMLLLGVESAQAQTAQVQVIDHAGRVVLSSSYKLSQGKNLTSVSVMPLPAGMYRLRVLTKDGVSGVYPFVK